MAPIIAGRTRRYPSLVDRARELKAFAAKWKIPYSKDYEAWFQPDLLAHDVEMATIDAARKGMVPRIVELVDKTVGGKGFCWATEDGTSAAQKFISQGLPVPAPKTIQDVINGGWRVYLDGPSAQGLSAFERLNDLVIKSIEAWEFNERKV